MVKRNLYADILMSGGGMLDSGRIFSYTQLVIDNDIFKVHYHHRRPNDK
jgi:trimethylamine:corrinoid methyltransferase-like protein